MARRSGELSGSILGRWESPFVFAVAVTFLLLIGSAYVTAPQPATAVPSRTVTVDPGGALLAQARASLAAGNGPAMGPSSLPGNGSVAATWLKVVPTSTSTPAER